VITRLSGYYSALAVMLLNALVALVAFNALLYGIYRIRDAAQRADGRRENMVVEKYGDDLLSRAYPGVDVRAIHEMLDETWGWRQPFAPYVHFKEQVRSGKYVNVQEPGFRVSIEQGPWPPAPDGYNVFVFGGSTTFSYGLPDDQTVASNLQKALTARIHGRVSVYNFAVGSYQSTQERILFQELLVKAYRPRLAIFIDGLNDFAYPEVPAGTYLLARLTRTPNRPGRLDAFANWPAVRLAKSIHDRLSTNAAGDPSAADRPAQSHDEDSEANASSELIEGIIQRYLANKRQIERVATEFAIQPIFVWQPIPFYKHDNAYHLFRQRDPGINRYAERGYARMAQMLATKPAGDNFIWCADIQQELKEPLYVDSIHYTAAMSDRLARYIVAVLSERGFLRDRPS
jgi:hypothetical protein